MGELRSAASIVAAVTSMNGTLSVSSTTAFVAHGAAARAPALRLLGRAGLAGHVVPTLDAAATPRG